MASRGVYRRLVAFDLDGTVLKRNGRMPPQTRMALEAAHAAGCVVVVSTGRALSMIPRFIRNATWVDYLSLSCGVRVVRARSGETVFFRPMRAEAALALMAANPAAAWQVVLPDRCVAEWRSLWWQSATHDRQFIAALGGLRALLTLFRPVRSVTAVVKTHGGPVEKLNAMFLDPVSAARLLACIRESGDMEAVTMTGYEVEVTARGATKGAALAWIAARESVPKEGVIAFGDSGNDLSMAEAAGFFVAVGNATPEVKQVADAVAPSVDEDGVGVYLREWLKNGGV